MLRALKINLPSAGNHHSRRRRNRFVPSIGGSASHLEDRALLSGAGGAAHAAVAAHDLAATPAGRHVTAMFESILHAAPTTQQVDHWVHRVRAGGSLRPLQRQLVVEARAQATTRAAIAADPTVSVSPSGVVTVGGTTTAGAIGNGLVTGATNIGTVTGALNPAATTGTILPSATLPAGLTSSVVGSMNSFLPGAVMSSNGTPSIAAASLAQVPVGVTFAGPSSGGGSSLGPIATAGTSATVGSAIASLINMLPSATNPGTATTGAASYNSPLGELLTTGTVPTPGLNGTTTTIATDTIGVPSPLTYAPLTYAPLAFTPTVHPVGPVNASPVPLNGTLPFTGTPVNPSPVSFTGTLPFTGTPANPSPISLNGTLPFTGTPANPSPVPVTGGLF